MLIRDMDISRLMVYVQQVEKEKLRDREEYKNKKVKTDNEFSQHKGGSSRPQFRNKKGMHHHILVHLLPESEVSIMARIHKTLRLDQHSPKVVWNKEMLSSGMW